VIKTLSHKRLARPAQVTGAEVLMMDRRFLSTVCVAVMMGFGVPTVITPVAAAQSEEKAKAKTSLKKAGKATKQAGKAIKQAGKEVGTAGKEVGKAAGQGAKAAAKKTAEETKEAAAAAQRKLDDAPKGATAKCQDGTFSTVAARDSACAGHGGVATWYESHRTPGGRRRRPPDAFFSCRGGSGFVMIGDLESDRPQADSKRGRLSMVYRERDQRSPLRSAG
jgi:hypothetical protein